MTKRVITISREFGSGGRTVGRTVAEKLGIAYYDKELVKHVALETGFDEAFIEDRGEHARSGRWLSYGFASRGIAGAATGLSVEDFLWTVQCRVITQLAEKEPCVIVGRCADYILKDRNDCLNVFIHADKAFRAERIVRLYGESENSPEKRLNEKDKKRSAYYRHYTDREWGLAENYHMSLNSSYIGIDKCVEIIIDIFNNIK